MLSRNVTLDGASPVVSVILVVLITILLAAVIGTFLFGLSDEVPQSTNGGGISVEETENGFMVQSMVDNQGEYIIKDDSGNELTVISAEAGKQKEVEISGETDISIVYREQGEESLVRSETVSPTQSQSVIVFDGTGDDDLQTVVNEVSSGSTIKLESGDTYPSIVVDKPLTITGDDTNPPEIMGVAVDSENVVVENVIFYSPPGPVSSEDDNTESELLSKTSSSSDAELVQDEYQYVSGLLVTSNGHMPELTDTAFTGSANAEIQSGGEIEKISDSTFDVTTGTGSIYLHGGTVGTIENNLFTGDAIYVTGDASSATIVNNQFGQTSESSVSLGIRIVGANNADITLQNNDMFLTKYGTGISVWKNDGSSISIIENRIEKRDARSQSDTAWEGVRIHENTGGTIVTAERNYFDVPTGENTGAFSFEKGEQSNTFIENANRITGRTYSKSASGTPCIPSQESCDGITLKTDETVQTPPVESVGQTTDTAGVSFEIPSRCPFPSCDGPIGVS